MPNLRIDSLICIFCLVLLSGCLAGVSTKQAEDLNTQVNNYGKLIRWRAFDDAATYIRTRDGQPVKVDTAALKEIRVTSYQVLTIELNEENNRARVTAEISYYHERVNNVHTIQDQQLWWRDEESGRWFVDGQLPSMTP